ncbi:lactonase family protein [Aquimarina sediminis]|uniref:lactonase family protein n=1 Tax=Aquimarina sediminis TaxID=2070536 RepID=UPI000CA0453B|nr:beta-propeller fold lactonase family protein [Aquimarina sediminis]
MEIIESIYVATNKVESNSVVGFARQADNSLIPLGEFKSGGKGTGKIEIFDWGYDETHPLKDGIDPLISAYGVFKTPDNKFILVVNAGDGTISSFKLMPDRTLLLSDTKPAGDIHPLSIATHNNLVYVASAGSQEMPTPPFTGNLMGYTINDEGQLSPIENSKRELMARPSCLAFTPNGKFLVVNELVTGLVKVYSVNSSDGTISKSPTSSIPCPHDTENDRWLAIPVGFDIVEKNNKSIVLVSEARFLNNNGTFREEANKVPQSPLYSWQTGSTSSFAIDEKGNINLISGDIYTGKEKEGGQIANCWVEASYGGEVLWAANALSSSISTYKIKDNGEITLINETAFKDNSELLFFGDLMLSKNGSYIYQLIGNKGGLIMFEVEDNANLVKKEEIYVDELPEIGSYGVIVV